MRVEPPRDEKGRESRGPGIVQILSCLLEASLWGLLAGVILQAIYALSYYYMRSPAGAWVHQLVGLDRNWTLVVVYVGAVLNKLTVLWLAILCLIIWQWKKGLERAIH